MSTKFMNFLCMCWFISILICIVIEGSYFGATENRVINDLSLFTSQRVGGLFPVPMINVYFFRGVFRLLTWDYSFYYEGYEVLRWMWMCILSPGAVWGLIQVFTPIIAQIIRIF